MNGINNGEELLRFLKTKLEVGKEAIKHLKEKDLDEAIASCDFMILEDYNLDEGFYCEFYCYKELNEQNIREMLESYFSDVSDTAHLDNPISLIDLRNKRIYRVEIKTKLEKKEVCDNDKDKR